MTTLKSVLTTFLLTASTLSVSLAAPWQDAISRADWSVNAKPSVVERNFTKKDVAQFVDNWRGVYIEWEDSKLAEPPAKPNQVGDFKWLDIDKDGIYELFVTFAETRAFFSGPSIYKVVSGKKIALQHFGGKAQNIGEMLEDLDGDGTPELVLKTSAAPSSVSFGTASPKPVWFEIYQWNGQKFEEASQRFTDFYLKRQLPAVEVRIEKIRSQLPDLTGSPYEEQRRDQAFYEKELAAEMFSCWPPIRILTSLDTRRESQRRFQKDSQGVKIHAGIADPHANPAVLDRLNASSDGIRDNRCARTRGADRRI